MLCCTYISFNNVLFQTIDYFWSGYPHHISYFILNIQFRLSSDVQLQNVVNGNFKNEKTNFEWRTKQNSAKLGLPMIFGRGYLSHGWVRKSRVGVLISVFYCNHQVFQIYTFHSTQCVSMNFKLNKVVLLE